MKKLSTEILFLAAALLPIYLLFIPGQRFGDDWSNILWMVEYGKEHLIQKLQLPVTYNTDVQVGIPFPIFYAPLMIPLMSFLAVLLGSGIAMRSVIVLLWIANYFLTKRICGIFLGDTRIGRFIPILASWSLYSMTNLYIRGAVCEAMGYQTFLIGLKFIFLFCINESRNKKLVLLYLGALFLGLTAGTHTITAYFSSLFSIPLLSVIFFKIWNDGFFKMQKNRIHFCAAIIGAIALNGPFLFVTGTMHKMLATLTRPVLESSEIIDTWISRWLPFPINHHLTDSHIRDLDAPIDTLILLLIIGILIYSGKIILSNIDRIRMSFFFFSLLPFLYAYFTSVTTEELGFKSQFGRLAEFSYRFAGISNIFLHLSLVAVLWLAHAKLKKLDKNFSMKLLLGILVLVGLIGIGVKLNYSRSYMNFDSYSQLLGDGKTKVWNHPESFGSYGHYADLSVPEVQIESLIPNGGCVNLDPIKSGPFDKAMVTFNANQTGYYLTNVLSFPWNEVWVDGSMVKHENLKRVKRSLAIPLKQGVHRIELNIEVPVIWIWLRTFALLLLTVWVLITTLLSLEKLVFRHRSLRRSEESF